MDHEKKAVGLVPAQERVEAGEKRGGGKKERKEARKEEERKGGQTR